MTTDPHIQLENQRLTNELDRVTRLYQAEADISRAAEHLYRIIIEKATYTSGGPFGNAVLNLGQALRNRHNMDGGGR
jgi:hypothetical protein